MNNTQLNKYFYDDNVFNLTNKMFISLQDNEVKRNNVYLDLIIKTLIEKMKLKNSLFQKAYKEIIFCGSFYKGTKVGHPNEFDLNIILELPIICDHISFNQMEPAFIQIFVRKEEFVFSNTSKYNNLSNKETRLLRTFIHNGFLNPDKVRQWVESIISTVICELPKDELGYYLRVMTDYNDFTTILRVKKSGPAFTLIFRISQESDWMHVDLVPALAFNIQLLSRYLAKFNELSRYRNKTWYAIPLPLNNSKSDAVHWRLSFCNQEKELLSKYGRIKPVIRQLKKLRDVQNWKGIASYYIETLCLNTLNELEKDLNKIPLTLLFYTMLKELCHACKQHELTFLWDERYNLFEKIGSIEMYNICSRLNNIIKNIEKNVATNKFILAEYILTRDELKLLIAEYNKPVVLPSNCLYEEDEPPKNNSCAIL